ncbi:Viral dihydrofolate reductase-like [Homarus americanus]|uniref:dihydrofolate reductase n=2 Tax=Homarus americanus TaxID=6706 RepID=A0A8J5NAJ2_HOMAM|nr:Viral dihydrofolate reductase-like [Homarus americanus]
MKHFSRITKRTSVAEKQNVVLMGRKTWESIPIKFRPLPGRLNMVLTTKAKSTPSLFTNSICCSNFDEALSKAKDRSKQIETVWAIGGSSIYEMALESKHLHRIYLTRILKDFTCDTVLPYFDISTFTRVQDPDVPSEVQQEGDIKYKYEIYEKIRAVSSVLKI